MKFIFNISLLGLLRVCFGHLVAQTVKSFHLRSWTCQATPTSSLFDVKIAHPCIDGPFSYGFKDPIALCGFLNAVLSLPVERQITQVSDITHGDIPIEQFVGRYLFLGCQTKDDSFFTVQMANYNFVIDNHMRVMIDHSRMISQLKSVEFNNAKINVNNIDGIFTIIITNRLMNEPDLFSQHL